MPNFDISSYIDLRPAELRRRIRSGEITSIPTAGMSTGYAQANLVILPKEYAEDFEEFARLNPAPCPILEILYGDPHTHDMGEDGNILTDIPEYFIYKDGKLNDRCTDATAYWQEGMVGFLIGCSFSFEEALTKAGIEVRHIATGRNVPMYKTNMMTKPAGPFYGPIVCSMRPMTPENARLAYEITAAMPHVHGAPLHIGDPADLGIADVNTPDYGEAVDIHEGEVTVFWPCGVTPQAAIENAKPPSVITHSPGHMFVTDILNRELNDYLARKKMEK
ncbi:MAG: putative hydro-lyase [Spirochaetales bacterium]|nr:MAG: putative hydro-lyase [Spirochaetales bacterium]